MSRFEKTSMYKNVLMVIVVFSIVMYRGTLAFAQNGNLECKCATHVGACSALVETSDYNVIPDASGNTEHKFKLSIAVQGAPACSDVSFQYNANGKNAVITGVPEYVVVFKGHFEKYVAVRGPWEKVSLPSQMECRICPGTLDGKAANDGTPSRPEHDARMREQIDRAVEDAMENADAASASAGAAQLDLVAVQEAAARALEQAQGVIGAQNAAAIRILTEAAAAANQRIQQRKILDEQRQAAERQRLSVPSTAQQGGSHSGGARTESASSCASAKSAKRAKTGRVAQEVTCD